MSGKHKITLRCTSCGFRWTRIVSDAKLAEPDPPCRRCKTRYETRGIDFDNPRAPANVGQNPRVNAIDQTAEIVMQDHGMTDLRSDVREGETMAPKLAPKLQAMADNMFVRKGRNNPLQGVNAGRLARQAMSGAFAPQRVGGVDPVAATHEARVKPPVRIINQPRQR